MKLSAFTAGDLNASLRIDAKFYLSQENPLLRRLEGAGLPFTTVAETFGRDAADMPGRFSRVWSSGPEHGKPLLAPYDAFRYLPWSRSYLSRSQVAEYESAEIHRGTLLIVRSGRNLGPVSMTDSFLERFVMSDDMIRLRTRLDDDAFYFYAFLSTPTGQELIRRDRNGSVIDHLGPEQILRLRYPVVDQRLKKICSTLFRRAFENREIARNQLCDIQRDFLKWFQLEDLEGILSEPPAPRRFTVTRTSIVDRFDAEPCGPAYGAIRTRITAKGGRCLGEIAVIRKPASRYKTTYVDDPAFGIPLLNGRQVSQYRPIAMKHMNVSGFRDPRAFRVEPGMTLLTADGRAEENLADCVMVTGERGGWGASGHVHRIQPLRPEDAGLIYLACACAPVQAQLKALATGSVVDALSEDDVGSVMVPYEDSDEARALGDAARAAWRRFSRAALAEERAIRLLERTFS